MKRRMKGRMCNDFPPIGYSAFYNDRCRNLIVEYTSLWKQNIFIFLFRQPGRKQPTFRAATIRTETSGGVASPADILRRALRVP